MTLVRPVFAFAIAATVACIVAACSGGDGGSSSGSSGGPDDDTSCLMQTTLSGGINATVGDKSQACAYSQRSVAFAPLEENAIVVALVVSDVERGQTGTFPARIDVSQNKERWDGATCSVNVESNVKDDTPVLGEGDSGPKFDRYRLRGNGTCSTPATFRGDAGAKEPVTIAPFTFVFTSLFY